MVPGLEAVTSTELGVGAALSVAVVAWLLACVRRPDGTELELAGVAMTADAPAPAEQPLRRPERSGRPIAEQPGREQNQPVSEIPETPRTADALPLVRRGYDPDATVALLENFERRLQAALAERDAAQARIAELEQEVTDAQAQRQAVVDALVIANRVRAESEREAEDWKEQTIREAETLRTAAKRTAEEIVRAAEADAHRIVDEARARSGDLEHELRSAGSLAEQTHFQLTAFLESLKRLEPNGSPADGDRSADVPRA